MNLDRQLRPGEVNEANRYGKGKIFNWTSNSLVQQPFRGVNLTGPIKTAKAVPNSMLGSLVSNTRKLLIQFFMSYSYLAFFRKMDNFKGQMGWMVHFDSAFVPSKLFLYCPRIAVSRSFKVGAPCRTTLCNFFFEWFGQLLLIKLIVLIMGREESQFSISYYSDWKGFFFQAK